MQQETKVLLDLWVLQAPMGPWENLDRKALLGMTALQAGMVRSGNGVIVETLGLPVYQALLVLLALLAQWVHLETLDRGEIRVLEVLWDHLAELENVVYQALKDLGVTKVTMEIEVTEVRRATEASLVFRVSPGPLVQMASKAVPESLVHLAQEVLQAQLVHQEKKETLVHLGQLGPPVCVAV